MKKHFMYRKPEHKLRQEIAQRAARLLAIDDARDFLKAKRKAASQLGVSEKKYLPDNIEIELALAEYQQLFHRKTQHNLLLHMRLLAIKSMRKFHDFNPLLTGPVLTGTASQHSEITLHLFCNNPEEIVLHMINHSIPYETCERKLRAGRDNFNTCPAYKFIAGEYSIVLIAIPVKFQLFPPLDPVDSKPMYRATVTETQLLIDNMQTEYV